MKPDEKGEKSHTRVVQIPMKYFKYKVQKK